MADFDSLPPGTFCWPELGTTDQKSAVSFYRALFGWEADADSLVAPQVSDAGAYGFVASSATANGSAIRGGIGGGPSFRPHALFYVGVPNVAAALDRQ